MNDENWANPVRMPAEPSSYPSSGPAPFVGGIPAQYYWAHRGVSPLRFGALKLVALLISAALDTLVLLSPVFVIGSGDITKPTIFHAIAVYAIWAHIVQFIAEYEYSTPRKYAYAIFRLPAKNAVGIAMGLLLSTFARQQGLSEDLGFLPLIAGFLFAYWAASRLFHIACDKWLDEWHISPPRPPDPLAPDPRALRRPPA